MPSPIVGRLNRLHPDRHLRVQRWLLYAAIVVAPLHVYRRPLGPLNVSLFRLCVGALIVVVMAGLVTRRRELLASAAWMRWAIVAMIAFLALDVVERNRNATGLGNTIVGQRAIFFASMVVVAAAALVLRARLGRLRRAFLASAVLPYCLAVEQWIRGTADQALPLQGLIGGGGLDITRSGVAPGGGNRFRPAATFSDPNFLAVFCAVTFMLADQHRRRTRGPERLLALACQAASVFVLVLSGSRTGVVTLGTYVAVVGLIALARQYRQRSLAVGVGMVGVVVLVAFLSIALLGRGNASVSSERHLETRLTAIGVGASHPIRGIGLGNLGLLLSEPPDRSSAHALPFTIFAEEGVLGVLLCGVALGIPIVRAARIRTDATTVGLAASLAVAVWFYDFAFALDVAALWWAFVIVRSARATAPSRAG